MQILNISSFFVMMTVDDAYFDDDRLMTFSFSSLLVTASTFYTQGIEIGYGLTFTGRPDLSLMWSTIVIDFPDKTEKMIEYFWSKLSICSGYTGGMEEQILTSLWVNFNTVMGSIMSEVMFFELVSPPT